MQLSPTLHKLKTWSEYFQQVLEGNKTYEVRQNDRDYQQGDYLFLQEYNQVTGEYTGRDLLVVVTHILHGGQFGIQAGYCVMGIRLCREDYCLCQHTLTAHRVNENACPYCDCVDFQPIDI